MPPSYRPTLSDKRAALDCIDGAYDALLDMHGTESGDPKVQLIMDSLEEVSARLRTEIRDLELRALDRLHGVFG